jgi:hypothetical protein
MNAFFLEDREYTQTYMLNRPCVKFRFAANDDGKARNWHNRHNAHIEFRLNQAS